MSFQPIISIYGRWSFMIDSETRPGLKHIVDLEPELNDQGDIAHGGEPWKCSCEAHHFNLTRPCKHTLAVIRWLKPIFKYAAAFEPKKRAYTLDPNKVLGKTQAVR